MLNKPTFLMTDPAHFEVSYTINPWMRPDAWLENEAANRAEARASERALAGALMDAGARVITIEGKAGLPDMVFPANAAVVLNGRAVASRFRFPERQGEEAPFVAAFERLREEGLLTDVTQLPKGVWQEGAGDCMWDASRSQFWAGFGPRSSRDAIPELEAFFEVPVVALELVSRRFYHLDTCFVPLKSGDILYYPPAFSKRSLDSIRDRVDAEHLIEANDEDAARFAVNAVCVGREIVMAEPTARLADRLKDRSYRVRPLNLRPFIMSGGGAYCMTLRLDLVTQDQQTAVLGTDSEGD